jgi:fumarate reductase flavoprotein subunit
MNHNAREVSDGKGAMNRRSFLAGAAGVGVAAMSGMLTACSSPKSANSKSSADTQASSSANWFGEAPEIGSVSNTITCDVLVIGGGTGGLFTACSAAEEGAHVIVLEKFAQGGGIRDDLGAANSRYQKADGCVIDKQAMAQDMYRYANGYCN